MLLFSYLIKKNVVNFWNTCIHESHPGLIINDDDRLTCLIQWLCWKKGCGFKFLYAEIHGFQLIACKCIKSLY